MVQEMITSRCKSTVKARLGPGKEDMKSMRILNRVVHWAPTGIEYEEDQRHAEIIVKELGLASDSKSVRTPGIASRWEDLDESE